MTVPQFIPLPVENDFWHDVGIPSRGNSLYTAINHGFAYSTIQQLSSRTGVDIKRISISAGIKSATLQRRSKDGKFKSAESDALHRYAEVYEAALALFEQDSDLTTNWMVNPVKALGNKKPIDMLETSAQASEVLNVIGRLEHGVFS